MNFLEAAEIAKYNPGSHFCRGESGLFVVHLEDGEVISSVDQASARKEKGGGTTPLVSLSAQLAGLEESVSSLRRQLEVDKIEIRQLRREVNNLKESISKIPSSEWNRYEAEQQKIDELRKLKERERIIRLARSGKLSHDQLTLVFDNATSLGIVGDELSFISAELIRTRRKLIDKDSFAVHATTDGQ